MTTDAHATSTAHPERPAGSAQEADQIVAERPPARRGEGRGRRRARGWLSWSHLVPFLVFFVVAMATVGWHLHKYPYASPIDEGIHFDYIVRLPDTPDAGDRFRQDTLESIACRGYPPELGYPTDKCGNETYDPNLYPGAGFSYGGPTPPAYYIVEAVIARPVAALTGWDLWGLSRALGAGWLFALMALGYTIGIRLGASRTSATAAAVIVATSSSMLTSASTIGPDTATAVVGGLVVLAALNHDRSRRTTLWLLGAVALAGLTKLTTFTAIGVAIILLLVRGIAGQRAARRARRAGGAPEAADGPARRLGPLTAALGTAVVMFAIFGLMSYLWGLHYRLTAKVHDSELPTTQMFLTDKIPWEAVLQNNLITWLSPITRNWNAPFLEGNANIRLEEVVAGLLVIGLLAGVFAWREHLTAFGIALGTLVLALVGPTILTLLNFYVNEMSFAISPRYGYGLLAGMIALLARLTREPGPARALAVVALLSVASALL